MASLLLPTPASCRPTGRCVCQFPPHRHWGGGAAAMPQLSNKPPLGMRAGCPMGLCVAGVCLCMVHHSMHVAVARHSRGVYCMHVHACITCAAWGPLLEGRVAHPPGPCYMGCSHCGELIHGAGSRSMSVRPSLACVTQSVCQLHSARADARRAPGSVRHLVACSPPVMFNLHVPFLISWGQRF